MDQPPRSSELLSPSNLSGRRPIRQARDRSQGLCSQNEPNGWGIFFDKPLTSQGLCPIGRGWMEGKGLPARKMRKHRSPGSRNLSTAARLVKYLVERVVSRCPSLTTSPPCPTTRLRPLPVRPARSLPPKPAWTGSWHVAASEFRSSRMRPGAGPPRGGSRVEDDLHPARELDR